MYLQCAGQCVFAFRFLPGEPMHWHRAELACHVQELEALEAQNVELKASLCLCSHIPKSSFPRHLFASLCPFLLLPFRPLFLLHFWWPFSVHSFFCPFSYLCSRWLCARRPSSTCCGRPWQQAARSPHHAMHARVCYTKHAFLGTPGYRQLPLCRGS